MKTWTKIKISWKWNSEKFMFWHWALKSMGVVKVLLKRTSTSANMWVRFQRIPRKLSTTFNLDDVVFDNTSMSFSFLVSLWLFGMKHQRIFNVILIRIGWTWTTRKSIVFLISFNFYFTFHPTKWFILYVSSQYIIQHLVLHSTLTLMGYKSCQVLKEKKEETLT